MGYVETGTDPSVAKRQLGYRVLAHLPENEVGDG